MPFCSMPVCPNDDPRAILLDMSILFGHPSGNPNSFHAALAHFEAGRLEAFCVPWMPSEFSLSALRRVPMLMPLADRLARRHFSPLNDAPKVQGRLGEFGRLLQRGLGRVDERLSYRANDWLMGTMQRECSRAAVTAVHAYEDCSLRQFEEARRLGKACVYDMPIGYYPAWERTQSDLARKYADWLPAGGLSTNQFVRPEQKALEMQLADIVLAPSSFVESTIRTSHPGKKVCRAPYGVDLEFWRRPAGDPGQGPLRFIHAGQISLRKGIPLLLEAWGKAALPEAELQLVGSWQLAADSKANLPRGVSHLPPCSRDELLKHYIASDVFVFPSFFEGFALAMLEAMACGLPVIASEVTDREVLPESCGRVLPMGNLDALVEALRWFNLNRDRLPAMRRAVRANAESYTWENYRRRVTEAVESVA